MVFLVIIRAPYGQIRQMSGARQDPYSDYYVLFVIGEEKGLGAPRNGDPALLIIEYNYEYKFQPN